MISRTCRCHRRAAVVFTAALLLAGCGAVRYPATYLMDLDATTPAEPPRGDLGPLAIRELQCPAYLCDGRLVYRPTPSEVGFYEFHRWAISPRQMISRSLAAAIQQRGLFTSVTLRDGIEAPAYLLTGTIERLEEVDRGHEVNAVCVVSAQLVDVRAKSVVWARSASATVAVAERSVPGVVNSLTAATRTTIDTLVASMQAELASAGRR